MTDHDDEDATNVALDQLAELVDQLRDHVDALALVLPATTTDLPRQP
jgi:hypothetical protein